MWLTRPQKVISIGTNLTVQETRLGWTISGGQVDESYRGVNSIVIEEKNCPDMVQLTKSFFSLGDIVSTQEEPMSDNDKLAVELLRRHTHKVGSRYETSILWVDQPVELPDSYKYALHRLIAIEKLMEKDPNLRK